MTDKTEGLEAAGMEPEYYIWTQGEYPNYWEYCSKTEHDAVAAKRPNDAMICYSPEQLAAARLQGAVVNQGLLDCLKELRAALDPDDWMGEVTMHDFIDAAIAEAQEGK